MNSEIRTLKPGSLFYRPQYFPFPSGRAWQTFYAEAHCLQQPPDGSLGAVGGEYSAGAHEVMEPPEQTFAPHFGLLFGGEGVEVDHGVG